MTTPLISVIVPTRNEERLIAATLSSILNSALNVKGSEIEVIVVDNDSCDHTVSIVSEFVERSEVRLIHAEVLGAARARNRGRISARGEILVFIDADTLIEPDCLPRIVSHCASNQIKAGIVRLRGINEGWRAWVWWRFWDNVRLLPIPHAKAMPAVMFCTSNAFDEFGPFDESVAIGEEWPILAGVYRHCRDHFVYDRSITAFSSSRRMENQSFGYLKTFLKYVWAVLDPAGRIHYSDKIR
ncbi:MAG: glycosyltransferase [Planctomycetes bacterium]|nr:glycosyltransferase [Planctomycetota bacterium]